MFTKINQWALWQMATSKKMSPDFFPLSKSSCYPNKIRAITPTQWALLKQWLRKLGLMGVMAEQHHLSLLQALLLHGREPNRHSCSTIHPTTYPEHTLAPITSGTRWSTRSLCTSYISVQLMLLDQSRGWVDRWKKHGNLTFPFKGLKRWLCMNILRKGKKWALLQMFGKPHCT